MSNSTDDIQTIETMKNSLKEIEEEVNTIEVEQVKELVEKYDVVLNNDVEEKELIPKYESLYDQLSEFVINKRKQVQDIEDKVTNFSELLSNDNFKIVLNMKKENINEIICCINRIVERIRELETTVFNNKMKELDNLKFDGYYVIEDVIENSMNILKNWSGKTVSKVIFDSKVDGDGWTNNMLHNSVLDRSNLYFITYDYDNNVFGGYINNKIDKSSKEFSDKDCYIYDNNSFTFSLIRNGKVKNKLFAIKSKQSLRAFYLYKNNDCGYLYKFGNVVTIKKVGVSGCSCYCTWNNYYSNYEQLSFMSTGSDTKAKRIIVIQMS